MSSAQELDQLLEENYQEIVKEYKEKWEMSPSDPDNLEGFLDSIVEEFGLNEIEDADSAEITDIRTNSGDPYVISPECYTGTIKVSFYNGQEGSTPSVGLHFDVEVDRGEGDTYVTVQPGSADSVELTYDKPLSPSQLKGMLEDDLS